MLRNKKVLAGIVILALVVAGGGFGYSKWNNGGGSSKNKDLVILQSVQRRTLQDTVTLNGTLAREELRNVTTVTQGRVERGVRQGRFDRTGRRAAVRARRPRRDRRARNRSLLPAARSSATAATTCCS